jgi:hypothetical protein
MSKKVDNSYGTRISLGSDSPTDASLLNIHEVRCLVNWCGWQNETYWDGKIVPTLNQILALWHACHTADYDTIDDWLECDNKAARAAWDRIVRGIVNE